MMQAMKNQWKKRNGYKDPEPPDCSSSLKEWEQIVKKYENPKPEKFTPENDPYGGY